MSDAQLISRALATFKAKKHKRRKVGHSVAVRKRAVRMLERGKPWREVGARFKVSTGVLTRWRRQYGKTPTHHTKVHGVAVKLKAIERMRSGVPLAKVAKEVGCGLRTLRAWLAGDRLSGPDEQYFSTAYKRAAVGALVKGAPMMQLAAKLEISDVTLRSWRRQYAKRAHNCPSCKCFVMKAR